jgi:hypothetical protein
MKNLQHSWLIGVVLVCFSLGCEEPFNIGDLPQDTPLVDTASYVSINPPIGGFSTPEDILIGNDQLIYVADRGANRVVMLNRGGQVLSSRQMLHPVSLGQTSRLDLLVGGELVAANGDTVGAVFRIHLYSESPDSAHRLDLARIDTIWRELTRRERRFPGITVFGDNQYLVVRTGPDNSSPVDPDARLLLFDRDDRFISPVPGIRTGIGTGITINRPTSIVSFPQRRDFIVTQKAGIIEGVSYGALWFVYQQTPDFEGWVPRLDPERPEDRIVDFIRPYRFVQPEAVTIDKARSEIFIADAALDSVFKFNSRGRLKSESFGLIKTGGEMRRPTGLAFFEKVLYVADSERGVILRFRLSTDVPR